jgi:hypothetical protein
LHFIIEPGRLNSLGFEWDPFAAIWEKNFAALKAYKQENGAHGTELWAAVQGWN